MKQSFAQAVFFSVELSVSAIAKNHKNRVLTLLGGVEMFQMILVFLIFRKSKTPKSSETSRPPKSVKTLFL